MGEFIPSKEDLSLFAPSFTPSTDPEPPNILSTIKTLNLDHHPEGGWFVLTDTAPTSIPSPYSKQDQSPHTVTRDDNVQRKDTAQDTRLLSTTIFYFLSPRRPVGNFHRVRSRIVHTLHRGRGRYVLIHKGGRIESFVVGQDIEKGERLQWVVEGDVWKASYLLQEEGREDNQGLLISETVCPGFDYADHSFLSLREFKNIFPNNQAKEIEWLVKTEDKEEANGAQEAED